ncbi:MAG: hypothetical protein KGJ21_09375, partial [Pseudomonadota bacterium]|nr:hypothetical protein [Pseudomonadota bacterium]
MKPSHAPETMSRRYAAAALAVLLIAVVLFQSRLFLRPGFYGEEASIYYTYAWIHHWWPTLLEPHLGYYSLLDNVVTLLEARMAHLESAFYLSFFVTLFFNWLPFTVIWLGVSPYWRTTTQKIIASGIVLMVGQPDEVWMNLIDVQFHLCLLTFLILCETWEGRSRRCIAAYSGMLIVAGLTGVVSCLLAPLYLLRAIRERFPARWFAAVLCAACAVHIAVTGWLALHGGFAKRFDNAHPASYVNDITIGFLNLFVPFDFHFGPLHFNPILLVAAVPLFACAVWYFSKPLSLYDRLLFLGGYFLIIVPSAFTSLNGVGGGRYEYAPG